MKNFLQYFSLGLVFGLAFLLSAAYIFQVNTAFISPLYHIVSGVVIFFAIALLRRKQFSRNMTTSLLYFVIGFGAPSLVWFLLVSQAAGNFQVL